MIDEGNADGKPAAKSSLPQAAGPMTLVANDSTIPAAWSDPSSVDCGEGQQVLGELPFLVTHWLAGYHHRSTTADAVPAESEEQTKAVQTIERAANDLASAFATLGAFGTASRVSFVRWID